MGGVFQRNFRGISADIPRIILGFSVAPLTIPISLTPRFERLYA